jgi:electron transfer flavoprotein beta subunit
MKAKKKPMLVLKPEELGVKPMQRVKTVRVDAPSQRQKGVIVKTTAELVEALKQRGVLA